MWAISGSKFPFLSPPTKKKSWMSRAFFFFLRVCFGPVKVTLFLKEPTRFCVLNQHRSGTEKRIYQQHFSRKQSSEAIKNWTISATLLFFFMFVLFFENCIEWWIWWMILRLFSLGQKRSSESSRTTKLQRSKGDASWTSNLILGHFKRILPHSAHFKLRKLHLPEKFRPDLVTHYGDFNPFEKYVKMGSFPSKGWISTCF